jgi:hypothetical protein
MSLCEQLKRFEEWVEDPFDGDGDGDDDGGDDGDDGAGVIPHLPIMSQATTFDEGSFLDGPTMENVILGDEPSNGMIGDAPFIDTLDTNNSNSAKPNVKNNVKNNKRSLLCTASRDSAPISRRKKKPKGMPKRPLSAYNLYFQSERAKIIDAANTGDGASGGKIGFEDLGKIIGKKWRVLTEEDRKTYDKLAEIDSVRYRKEMEAYNQIKTKRLESMDESETSYKSLFASSDIKKNKPEQSLTGALQQWQSSEMPGDFAGLQQISNNSHESAHDTASSYAVQMMNHPPALTDFSKSHSHVQSSQQGQSQQQLSQQHQEQQQHARSHVVYSYPPRPLSTAPRCPPPPHSQMADFGMPRPNSAAPPPSSTSYLSFPPLPPGIDPVHPNQIALPAGMEIVLPDRNTGQDRKYRVQYACYSMSQEDARNYIESLTCSMPAAAAAHSTANSSAAGAAAAGTTIEVQQRHVRYVLF